ncbi:THAP domain-containing protein 7 [Sardina pilchardus]|uniref:THAP domain-containing protein 7 n=1 Tax=Sardina pilchardus TaxID=27697 RepID=UPI002E11ACE8
MPRHCSAGGCKSRDTRDSRKAGITFHRLPKRENPRRALWILNSRRTGPQGQGPWDPQSDFIYFCSKHFTKDTFELSGVSGYRRLKDDALPTVFESSAPKGRATKRATRGKAKQADTARPARTKARSSKEASGKQDAQQTAADSESVTGGEASHTSEAANGEADNQERADTGSSSQASSEIPVTPQQTHQSACDTVTDPVQQPSSPRPPSPSRYMRRLPPPPGFYLPREHSYAQLCPLVWRKRYDRAIDNLEKALRLLSAARRRENRLRHALIRLQESRLKSTLFRLRDGGGGRGREGRGGRGRPPFGRGEELGARGGSGSEESGGWRGSGGARGSGEREEDDGGCCFYCGRGRDDEARAPRGAEGDRGLDERDGEARRRRQVAKRGRARKAAETRADAVARDAPKECFLYYYQSAEKEDDVQVVTLGLPHPPPRDKDVYADASRALPVVVHPPAEAGCVQVHSLAAGDGAFPTDALQDSGGGSTALQLLQSSASSAPQGLLLADLVPGEGAATLVEGQQEYWVQHAADGSVVLLPVASAEDGGVAALKGLNEDAETQMIFVSDVGFHREGIRVEGDATGLRASDRQGGLQSNVRGAVLSGDVKEKLKEHLEGFQLQLSNEFSD